jgi:octaprenyl-diphosphate synthase
VSSTESNLVQLLAPVATGMDRTRSVLVEQLAQRSGAVADMTDHIGRFRGKQLRAALVLLAGDATGNSTDEHATVAAIVELIHLATLVHDDVLDGASVRRRVASVNQRWDNQVAVLLGDFLYARAFSLSTELSSRLCSQLLSRTTQKICVGEIDQAASRYDFEMDQARYEAIAGAKTGALYAAACELGASYPGGRESLATQMATFGYEIGLAFQIMDDVLDIQGEEEVVGKSVGTDVEDGKVTLPVLYTYREASQDTRARIRDAYTLPNLESRVEQLRSVCSLGAGVEFATARAEELVAQARARLSDLAPSPARTSLERLGEFVLERQF